MIHGSPFLGYRKRTPAVWPVSPLLQACPPQKQTKQNKNVKYAKDSEENKMLYKCGLVVFVCYLVKRTLGQRIRGRAGKSLCCKASIYSFVKRDDWTKKLLT